MYSLSIEEALRRASFFLKKAGLDGSRDEAEYLLSWASGKQRLHLFLDRDSYLPASILSRFNKIVERRCQGEPLAYITGVKEFYGMEFTVNRHVLIPRPETEGIVEAALQWANSGEGSEVNPIEAVDLGTGSGILAVTLARFIPRARVTAVDISSEALRVAAANAVRYGVDDRISWHRGDFFLAFSRLRPSPRFNLIVANPPYIKRSDLEALPADIIDFEPRMALDGGPDGLDSFRSLMQHLPAYAAHPCLVLFEIGAGQCEAVTALCRSLNCFRSLSRRLDYQGIPRIIEGLI